MKTSDSGPDSDPSPDEVERHLEELREKGTDAVYRDKDRWIDFEEVSEAVKLTKKIEENREKRSVSAAADFALDDVPGWRIKGGDSVEFLEIIRESEGMLFDNIMKEMIIGYAVAPEAGGDVGRLIEVGSGKGEQEELREYAKESIRRVCTSYPQEMEEYVELLLQEGDEFREEIGYLVVKQPEVLKEAIPEFKDLFKQDREEGDYRWLFCRYLAELSKIDPEYAREHVCETLEEIDSEEIDYEEDRKESSVTTIGYGFGSPTTVEGGTSILDCLRMMVERYPHIIREAEEMDPKVKRYVTMETRRARRGKNPDEVRRMNMEARLSLKEYMEFREQAAENGDSVREAVESGMEMYKKGNT